VKVLLVSDDIHLREEARFAFASEVTVSFALDSRGALRTLEREEPSVVVVDMQTGNAGGYAMARDMAETTRFANVPLLILLERDQDAWLARKAGATAFRTKPLRPGQLAREVMTLAKPRS
jgi:DNA-binding response OmpR family regulator